MTPKPSQTPPRSRQVHLTMRRGALPVSVQHGPLHLSHAAPNVEDAVHADCFPVTDVAVDATTAEDRTEALPPIWKISFCAPSAYPHFLL
jgi:hypothetical protein